jgi:hypothetical protein
MLLYGMIKTETNFNTVKIVAVIFSEHIMDVGFSSYTPPGEPDETLRC